LLELLTFPRGRPHGEPTPENIELALGDPAIAVRPSRLKGAGRGAFAVRNFEPGDVVGQYKCVVLPIDEVSDATRSWALNATHVCDGSFFPLNNPLAYVNSIASDDTCNMQNVVYHFTLPETIMYLAETSIRGGEELLVDYRKEFFHNLGSGTGKARPAPLTYTCNMPLLHSASAQGDTVIVHQVLAEFAMQHSQERSKHVDARANDSWTALMQASLHGHQAVVDLLIHQGADVDATVEETGRTSLHLACKQGHVSVLWSLVAARATVGKTENVHGASPLLLT